MDKVQQLNDLFALAQKDATVHSFEQTQQMFLSSLTSGGNVPKAKKIFTLKNWIIMLTIISTIAGSVLFLIPGTANHSEEFSDETNIDKKPIIEALHQKPEQTGSIAVLESKSFVEAMDNFEDQLVSFNPNVETENNSIENIPFNWNRKQMDDEPYQFPKLTEKEISATKKKKKAMLKALQKYDKDQYAYVPSGTFSYDSTITSVQAFYISKTEVTNFEYRTFLFDLLMQDRKEEFLIAKPNQAGWAEIGGKTYQDHYFSHDAYNEYPVVNVSKEGIELYCKWLSIELRKFVGEKKEGNYNDIRLPLRVEWVKAASNEGKQLPYPWNGPYMRNKSGLFQANFSNLENIDSTTYSNAETIPHQSDITAPSKSYWPNDLGLYNMSGNVAEMVYEDMSKKDVGTAGGSWRNTATEIQIYAPDTKKNAASGASDIGFRIVSTFLR